jgi:hypothetical protein
MHVATAKARPSGAVRISESLPCRGATEKIPFGPARIFSVSRSGVHLPQSKIRLDDLMQASEQRLGAAIRSAAADEQLVAMRIIGSPQDFTRWESYHAGLMRRIVDAGHLAAQRSELLSAALGLIHRKATFEYLRSRRLQGRDRVRFFEYFGGNTDYNTSVIAEHGKYLRSAASYMCSSHVGTNLLLDDTFDEPLMEYERLYEEYFRSYCDFVLAPPDSGDAAIGTLLRPLKREVSEWRNALFALTQSNSGIWRPPEELLKLRRSISAGHTHYPGQTGV